MAVKTERERESVHFVQTLFILPYSVSLSVKFVLLVVVTEGRRRQGWCSVSLHIQV